MSEYAYVYEYDKTYCYPATHVLKNKLNIENADGLQEAERGITALRILELKQAHPAGTLDFDYYKMLHRYIFQDMYSWAGKTRTVNISKGTRFCSHQYIDAQAEDLFGKLKNEDYLAEATENIADRLAFIFPN